MGIIDNIVSNWEMWIVGFGSGLLGLRTVIKSISYAGGQIKGAVTDTVKVVKGDFDTELKATNIEITELKSMVNKLVDKAKVDTKANIKSIAVDSELTQEYKNLEL